MRLIFFGLATFVLSACTHVSVAEPAAPPKPPTSPACTTEATPFRDFDFWIGAWDVTDPHGTIAGENVISREENGCLLVERWTGAQGGSGTSLNFVDPQTGLWRQVWMSQGAMIDYSGGLEDSGAMRLQGEITYTRTGKSFPFRGVWTPNKDGSVTQAFTQYDPETETWNDWFTGIYRRKSD